MFNTHKNNNQIEMSSNKMKTYTVNSSLKSLSGHLEMLFATIQ